MPTKTVRTWVVIADGARARVFETRGRGTGLTAVDGMALETEIVPGRAIATDRPGRSFESVGVMRHAMDTSDAHREQKRQFARRVVESVAARQAAKSFDRLVLVAPPATMGDLRALLPDRLKSIVTAEVVADLTKTPVNDLPSHLQDHIAL